MGWEFRPHVLQHRPTGSLLCTVFMVNFYLLQWFSVAPQIQHGNVSAECLLSKAELASLQQVLVTVFQGKSLFLL